MSKNGIIVPRDIVKEVHKRVTTIVLKKVLVGIPEKTATRKDDPINNATLGYIMEKGSPAANIPARPFLVPGVADVQGEIEEALKPGITAALSGDMAEHRKSLNAAGLIGAKGVQAKITTGPFVPLATSTLRARDRRMAAKGKKYYAVSIVPLIDTGQLRRSITYIVRSE